MISWRSQRTQQNRQRLFLTSWATPLMQTFAGSTPRPDNLRSPVLNRQEMAREAALEQREVLREMRITLAALEEAARGHRRAG